MALTREQVEQSMHPSLGKANPERVENAFWDWMIRQRRSAQFARGEFRLRGGMQPRDAAGMSAWRRCPNGPMYCFTRFGRTVTQLLDGRIVYVGGEHKDWYDPDFCIYNDVVVESADGSFDVYVYPEDIFPPTDFHTATLVEGRLYLIGNLGYRDLREIGETQVCCLDTDTFAIEPVITAGNGPGWIHGHRAEFDRSANEIRIWSGKVIDAADTPLRPNVHVYALHLDSCMWRKVEA